MNSNSRRQVARFIAARLVDGESPKRIARVLAAYLSASHQIRQRELIMRDIETELMNTYQHMSSDVLSARALTTETRSALVAMLRSKTGAKTVELTERIEKDLLGGLIVRTPEAEMDISLRSKLTRLKAI